jgi:hypothetical protein
MNLSGDLSFFCQKLIILNRLHLNLQVKNGSQIPVQRPNFFSEGLTHSAVPNPAFLERGEETMLRVNPCLPAGRLSLSVVLEALSLSKGKPRLLLLSVVEGLTFQDSSFNLKIILRLREQVLC